MTITPSAEEMEERIARFDDLEVIVTQKDNDIPLDVLDIIYSRELKPVITVGEDASSPFGNLAPIVGAAGISITYAICPEGTGPTLHSHKKTYETFTVMQGEFKFSWGDNGEQSVTLKKFDCISIPPKVNREFRNTGNGDGVLQVVISGGVHDRTDIAFPKITADKISAKGKRYLDFFREKVGLEFD